MQARNLPPADDDGTSDPYVVVMCCGQRKKTRIITNTLNPLYYETLTFDVELLPLHLAPVITLQVWIPGRTGDAVASCPRDVGPPSD